MTHSKLPRQTRSRPFGMLQTPFDPRTGKYLALGKDPNILKVVVGRRLTTTEHAYLCTVLDRNGETTGEKIHARRLTYGSESINEIPENTPTFVFRVDEIWWMQTGGEAEIPTTDYVVDMFDRSDLGNPGAYWDNEAIYRIWNQQAYHLSGVAGDMPYYAKLSDHNMKLRMSYSCSSEHLYERLIYLLNNPTQYNLRGFGYPFSILINWDILNEAGVWIRSYIRVSREAPNDPVYADYVLEVLTPSSSFEDVIRVLVTSPSYEFKNTGTILFTSTENILSFAGDPWVGSLDLEGVYNFSAGLKSPKGTSASYAPVIADNFKAWVSTIPEPPDESGHGRYIAGEYVYSDKYHAGSEYTPDV